MASSPILRFSDVILNNPERSSARPALVGSHPWAYISALKDGGLSSSKAKLALLERITLAPRQTLSLVEADDRRLLIATLASRQDLDGRGFDGWSVISQRTWHARRR